MSGFQAGFDTPEDAYLGFFEADRSRDGAAWAAVMSYPHVRIAASGNTEYFDTARDCADAADWAGRVATGWVRTAGREPVRLHESRDKVHLAGGWTRYNADDEPILWNQVTYVVTRPGLSWGVQARFAVGAYDDCDDGAADGSVADVATGLVGRYYDALDGDDGDACAAVCRFPMIEVGVGEVARMGDGAQVARRMGVRINNVEIRTVQSGADGAIVTATAEYASGGGEQSVLVVGRKTDTWRIAGISRIPTRA